MSAPDIKEVVKEKYGQAALRVSTGGSSCCGAGPALDGGCDPITSNLYDALQTTELPQEAVKASLGCGNPTALANLNPGETVLDLGSGGGIDVLLSAKRVGPTGKAYGLDMTNEMLALARDNQRKSGVQNVEFWGSSDSCPDNSVDVIISNCVINLGGQRQVLPRPFRTSPADGWPFPTWWSAAMGAAAAWSCRLHRRRAQRFGLHGQASRGRLRRNRHRGDSRLQHCGRAPVSGR
jgi:SAM-dependent methyltransferase